MMINGRNEILELLRMPDEQFGKAIIPQAKQTAEQTLGRTLRVTSMMGYTNICKNNCFYFLRFQEHMFLEFLEE